MLRPLIFLLIAVVLPALTAAQSTANDGHLETIRDDVRGRVNTGPPPAPPASGGQGNNRGRSGSAFRWGEGPYWEDDDSLTKFCIWVSFGAVTSPLWLPVAVTGDELESDCHFQRYPYQVTPGSIVRPGEPPGGLAGYATLADELDGSPRWLRMGLFEPQLRRWSGRVSAEYATEFADVDRIGGRLLLSTASRFGIDTEMNYLEERLADGGRDWLWLGDGNLVFRFAQSNWSEWRTGVGLNWLDDRQQTDYGFNFTYGVDLYPRRPWVVSLDVDWGTLGRSSLFRARTTAGVVVWGLESYIGYEYLDIGRTQCNQLIGGVRLWF